MDTTITEFDLKIRYQIYLFLWIIAGHLLIKNLPVCSTWQSKSCVIHFINCTRGI